MYVMKRKHVILISFVILVLIAGYLNWSYEKDQFDSLITLNEMNNNNMDENIVLDPPENMEKSEDIESIDNMKESDDEDIQDNEDSSIEVVEAFSDSTEDYFFTARIKRDDARSESVYLLNQMAENDNLPEKTRQDAQDELLLLADLVNKEAVIENLIIAKGFDDAVVFINKDYDVRVVVNTSELNDKSVAQIMDIIKTELDVDASKIKIMKKFE